MRAAKIVMGKQSSDSIEANILHKPNIYKSLKKCVLLNLCFVGLVASYIRETVNLITDKC